jgi:hypothetical protein
MRTADLQRRILKLQRRIEELEILLEINDPLPLRYSKIICAKQTAIIVNMLLKRQFLSLDAFVLALGTNERTAHSYLCHARKWLRNFGIEIETVWGEGWSIVQADKRKLKKILENDEFKPENNASSRRPKSQSPAMTLKVA